MNLENLRMLEAARKHLGALLDEVVFVGGATVELWITDKGAPEFRPTADVDVVAEGSILGFENRWQAEAFSHAVDVYLPSNGKVKAIPPPFLLATKLEAFASRGKLDFFGSRDFGDVVVLIDGREELVGEVAAAPKPLQGYLTEMLRELSEHRDFDRGLEGALPATLESRGRVDRVILPRVKEIVG